MRPDMPDCSPGASELLIRLEQRPDLAERARRLRIDRLRRRGVRNEPAALELLSELFVVDAADSSLIQSHSSDLDAMGIVAVDPTLAGARYSFLRGVLAFRRHDFASARAEFIASLETDTTSDAAVVAMLIVQWIDGFPDGLGPVKKWIHEDELLDEYQFDTGRTLVIVENATHLAMLRNLLGADARVTIVSPSPPDLSLIRASVEETAAIDVAFWYQDEGRRFHTVLERIAHSIGVRTARLDPRLAQLAFSVALYIIDSLRSQIWLVLTVRRFARRRRFNNVLVAASSVPFVAAITSVIGASNRLAIRWASGRKIWSPGLLPFWPRATQVRIAAMHRRQNRLPSFSRLYPTFRTPNKSDGEAPALLAWSLKDANYRAALSNIVREVLAERSAVILVQNATSEHYREMAQLIEVEARVRGHQAETFPLSMFTTQASVREFGLRSQFVSAFAHSDQAQADDANSEPRRAIERYLVAADRGQANHVCTIARIINSLSQRFRDSAPAYCLTSPGRTSTFSAIIEHCASIGVPTMDVHLYTHADSARQLASRAQYCAAIDSQQHDFLANHWGMDRRRIIRAGYVWARPTSAPSTPVPVDSATDAALRCCNVLFVGTQPGTPNQVEGLMHVVTELAKKHSVELGVVIKVHPREQDSSINLYRDVLSQLAGIPTALITGPIDMNDPMLRTSVLLTRTSNIGIEAAIAGIPVVRCCYLEPDLHPVFRDMIYAYNASDAAEAVKLIRALFLSARTRDAMQEKQRRYFERNPALVHKDGSRRIVDFMERDYERRAAAATRAAALAARATAERTRAEQQAAARAADDPFDIDSAALDDLLGRIGKIL